jgi:hypothetical protein
MNVLQIASLVLLETYSDKQLRKISNQQSNSLQLII